MSVVLAIDTAAPRLQLGLLMADGRIDVLVEAMPTGQAEALFPRLTALLERNGLGYADLTRIAVTTGPGSFTGLRIGLSAARGLGLALDVPVVGIPTLLALSLAGAPGRSAAVLVDARREEAYFQLFSGPGAPVSEEMLLPMAAAHAAIPAGADGLETPFVDIARLARFAVTADPAAFPPEASYVRGADAKPQDKARVARRGAA
jgi:tRNA threonylcarbamoyladenosine biosynthesis protein TsaB